MLNTLIVCPNARLARSIQNDIAQQYLRAGKTQWQSPQVLTLTQWLDVQIETGLLAGLISAPPLLLSTFNEQLLWQKVITQSLKKNAFGELFDIAGLSAAAMEANRYQIAWKLHIPREHQAEESRQFLHWQRAFQQRCQTLNALESVRYLDWQLDCLAQNSISMPARIAFAGFDQTAPQEQRLREMLIAQGLAVSEYTTTCPEPAQTLHVSLVNQDAECRAAVAWAQQNLAKNPKASLAIIAPQLDEIRSQLADLLEDAFTPANVRPSLANGASCYNFSLGTPLAQQPIIQAALHLLRLFSSYQLTQEDISKALLSPFWSASQREADARALLDANMREKLPAQLTLASLIAFAKQRQQEGLAVERMLADISAAFAMPSNKTTPLQMVQSLESLLGALNWPGERSLTSLEYQALNAWQKALQQLKNLDILGKHLSRTEAVHHLQQICTEQIFQAETEGEASIQILGMLESLSAPVDAMWVMQMNDHIWPPAARPNPLLPAFIQRAAGLPNADNRVQAAFAATIQHRLLHSAKNIVFSSSKSEGESQLCASPLLQGIAQTQAETPLAATLAEQLSQLGNHDLTQLDDHIAPKAEDHVSGGTSLFRAQAICPAWAFYQFRLGAKALKTPTSGLDNMQRGILVHDVLEQFWRERHFADLRDMPETAFAQALNLAIRNALRDFSEHNNAISKNLLALEHERLYKLIGEWLQYEKARGVTFNIVSCEAEKKVQIRGIEVTLKIDRIHALENGAIEFVDYKTGQKPKMTSWTEARITEPQLPIYAAFGAGEGANIAGVQFAWIKVAAHEFLGIAEENFAAEADKRTPKFIRQFDDWQAMQKHWESSIEAIADEIKAGEAAVHFADENLLAYCEVLPLLRLPERQLQFERFQGKVK